MSSDEEKKFTKLHFMSLKENIRKNKNVYYRATKGTLR